MQITGTQIGIGERHRHGAGPGGARAERRVQARALRHVVSVVPQEPFLFAASVHENNP